MKNQMCFWRASNWFPGNVAKQDVVKSAKIAFVASLLSIGALGLLAADTAHGALATYNFVGATVNDPANPVSALSTTAGNGEWSATATVNDANGNPVTLTSVEAWGPVYQRTGTGGSATWSWDGTTYTEAKTNIHSTTSGFGVHNANYTNPFSGNQNNPINLERQSFNAQESWTFQLDQPVIFNRIVFIVWANTLSDSTIDPDEITITVDGWETPIHYTGSNSTLNAPFGTDVIPAGTNITLFNSILPPATYANNTSNLIHGNWRISSLRFEVIPAPLPGDYNGDGVIDAADYVMWRDNLEGPEDSLLNRDPDNSGLVNQNDYDFWKANFGNPSNEGLGSVAAIPEPCSWMLLATAFVSLTAIAQRRRK